jgi:purine-binding chemotaxis protein CheW
MAELDQQRPTERLCVFRLQGRGFALPVAQAVEVLPAVDYTPIPLAPPLVAGLFNLRGELIPLLRLESLFGLSPRPPGRAEQYLVTRIGENRMALWVDRVVDIAPVEVEALGDLSPVAPYVRGRLEIGGTPTLLLDLDQIVQAAEDQITHALQERLSAPS